MNENMNSSLQFEKYKIKSFSFDDNEQYKPSNKPGFYTHFVNEVRRHDENSFSIYLTCEINKKQEIDVEEIPFYIHVTVEGFFKVEVFEDRLIPNAIAILFPYLRSFISTVTAQAGYYPFILPTININRLLQVQEKGKRQK